MTKIILIGRINKGHLPIGGETAKNQMLIKVFGQYCDIIGIDFYRNKQRPWVFLQAAWALVRYPKATIILSTTAANIYPLLKIFKFFGIKRNIIHWVIGGEFDKLVQAGRFDIDVLNVAKWHLAQSIDMAKNLSECGLKEVRYIPNFRHTPEISGKKTTTENGVVRFVFMSRIMPEKGVYEILECVERLNAKSYKERYSVDFYGPVDDSIRKEFEKRINTIPNVQYKGILNLQNNGGYDVLASYQAMLFPTFHPSEGIAGAIVDAFIAGVPVVTTDWRHNREVVTDNKTGIIIPVHDTDRLCEIMEDIISGKINLDAMSKNAIKEAENYKAENIINNDFLKKLGIL